MYFAVFSFIFGIDFYERLLWSLVRANRVTDLNGIIAEQASKRRSVTSDQATTIHAPWSSLKKCFLQLRQPEGEQTVPFIPDFLSAKYGGTESFDRLS
ncbi:hypothetical protein M513_00422 [Trichuris suis]|uniref:Uncharacterized protein n=1 Tax=Trichuris suis TaxID=68888 RepID=A0A085MND3_9BILA|nr:hypothetical protein M513_00422 [Trichuris suis]